VESTRAYLDGRPFPPKVIQHPYAFNRLQPQHGDRSRDRLQRRRDQGHQGDPQDLRGRQIAIGVTCVRVPVLRAHCEAITFECERPITEHDGARRSCQRAGRQDRRRPGEELLPDADRCVRPGRRSGRPHPTDLSDASGHSISMFVSADQLLKGAALNAIQIAELLPQRAMA
jgi:aspartate-semialdehyde dehydrogenase